MIAAAAPPKARGLVDERGAYRQRNLVERLAGRLKDFRRAATRYDKLARNYISGVLIAALCAYWLS